jgi:hypothetical protein
VEKVQIIPPHEKGICFRLGTTSMGTFRIPIHEGDGIHELLSDMPENVKAFAREGFELLPSFEGERFANLVAYLKDGFILRPQPDVDELKETFGFNGRQAGVFVVVLAIITVVITTDENTAKNVETLKEAFNLSGETLDVFTRLIDALQSQKTKLKKTLKESEIASEILPAFSDLHTTVDLRLGFEQGNVKSSVPVVVAYLTTDDRNSRVWFQMQKRDVTRLMSLFEKLLKQIDEVERWATREQR